jgi:hypothetical protein
MRSGTADAGYQNASIARPGIAKTLYEICKCKILRDSSTMCTYCNIREWDENESQGTEASYRLPLRYSF